MIESHEGRPAGNGTAGSVVNGDRTDSTPLEAATRAIHALATEAWREQRDRHRDWWSMATSERLRVLSYEAGFDDGYEQAVADIAAGWAGRDYWSGRWSA